MLELLLLFVLLLALRLLTSFVSIFSQVEALTQSMVKLLELNLTEEPSLLNEACLLLKDLTWKSLSIYIHI